MFCMMEFVKTGAAPKVKAGKRDDTSLLKPCTYKKR
jgi:hypothetical protein